MRVRFSTDRVVIEAEFGDTPTAKALAAAMPFESRAQTWGEEVYFSTPVSAKLEPDARQVVEPGTVCFWTVGDALALPWGRTPLSSDSKPKLASRCNVLGRLKDYAPLKSIRAGDKITVSRA